MTNAHPFQVHIGDEWGRKTGIRVGGFIVTQGDEAQFPWRHKPIYKRNTAPPPDDVMFPEACRVPKAIRNRNAPLIKFKTVCRIKSVTYRNADMYTNTVKKLVIPRDVDIEVQIFVRPSDIGYMQIDPYEVVETDQGYELLLIILFRTPNEHIWFSL